jgi:hypothetical protein
MCYSPEKSILVPVNPVGRTGLIGRGHLGRWGPNHAAGTLIFIIIILFYYFIKIS